MRRRQGELASNFVREIKKPRARRSIVIAPFTVEEVEALLSELRDRADHPAQWMLAELIA